jgi:hypothetical protein
LLICIRDRERNDRGGSGWNGLIRKNCFMKNDITASKHFMGCKVIEFVSFLTDGIAKKNTMLGTRGELMRNMHDSGICKTPKDSKMRTRREFAKKFFKRGFVRKKWCGQTVDYMNGSGNIFYPKT